MAIDTDQMAIYQATSALRDLYYLLNKFNITNDGNNWDYIVHSGKYDIFIDSAFVKRHVRKRYARNVR
jgi:hypothetical protein